MGLNKTSKAGKVGKKKTKDIITKNQKKIHPSLPTENKLSKNVVKLEESLKKATAIKTTKEDNKDTATKIKKEVTEKITKPLKAKKDNKNTVTEVKNEKIIHKKKVVKTKNDDQKIVDKYDLCADGVKAQVLIIKNKNDYVPFYKLVKPELQEATQSILKDVREKVISIVQLSENEFVDPKALSEVKKRFMEKSDEILKEDLPFLSENDRKVLVGKLIHQMLGLGDIELLLTDSQIEEIVINRCNEPVWIFHKKQGWMKTSIIFDTEESIYNLTSSIGRKVGREITNLNPLMDAHLSTGDRVNATMFPISSFGNTMTIRRFSRDPWTIVKMIDPKVKTMSVEIAALLWLCMQYELNILVVGGTASGKTSTLNSIIPFVPPNQRIVSIEDTREIKLPKFMHWVPLSSRQPNPEGKGGVQMIDLLANAMRMRPDRIIVGEIRRENEAEVMFEAIRTGHSAYATFHADRAEQAYTRITNPPINLPEPQVSALHVIIVQYRHRRLGVRRTMEFAEIIPMEAIGKNKVNVIYKWNPREDTFDKVGRLVRIMRELSHYTGMSDTEIEDDLKEKEIILNWMLKHEVFDVDPVGKIFAEYYRDPKRIASFARRNKLPDELI